MYFRVRHTEIKMQLSCVKLKDLRPGERAILENITLPPDEARRLMELGFLPGTQITAGRRAPGGDPRIFQVDGSEIALRAVTAAELTVRLV
jgi:ferrous iron transport protein A